MVVTRTPAPADIRPPAGGDGVCGEGDGWRALTADERAAWQGFLRAHAELQTELERELQAAHQLSFSDYFALLTLARADGGALRMHDLAELVHLTRSGLTRLVERLERAGLIERAPSEHDARGTVARITDDGRARLHAASATHLAGVRRRFLDRFSAEELHELAGLLARLVS